MSTTPRQETPGPVTTVAFFGHDADDAAVRRRVRAFADDGIATIGFMMRRGEAGATAWENHDLGRTRDSAYLQRLTAVVAGARRASAHAARLAQADLIYARNLDMLACALLARRRTGLDLPVVYECLDIHRLLTRSDAIGAAMRALERALLRRCRGLVVSSPGFLRHYFETHHAGCYRARVVENRMAAGSGYGARPVPAVSPPGTPLRIGWFGVLRCRRSFRLLLDLADRFGDRIRIVLHGVPARTQIPVFEPEIEARGNVRFGGRYAAPEDLARIYAEVDLVWAGDFMEAGFNSVWLLPNRLYEGGYYNTPAIAPAGTETAAWIEARAAGFTLPEPLDETLPALVGRLLDERGPILAAAARQAGLADDVFVQPPGFLSRTLAELLE